MSLQAWAFWTSTDNAATWIRIVLCHAPNLTGHKRPRPSDKQPQQQCSSQGRAWHRIRLNNRAFSVAAFFYSRQQSKPRPGDNKAVFILSECNDKLHTNSNYKKGVGRVAVNQKKKEKCWASWRAVPCKPRLQRREVVRMCRLTLWWAFSAWQRMLHVHEC